MPSSSISTVSSRGPLFDEYLSAHAVRTESRFVPFEIATDYREFVDAKSRQALAVPSR